MGVFALLLAFFCFVVPLAAPLFAQTWRSYGIVLAAGIAFIAWLNWDMANPGSLAQGIGSFLGGLMLVGFACGAIAKLVMLIGRRPASGN